MKKIFSKEKLLYILLGLILLIHALILTKLIYFPYPELFIYPYLTNHNLKPYSQILDQHFPGLMFSPVNFDNLGMNTPESARLWSVSIVAVIQVMLFLIGSKIFKSRTRAILINVLYLIWQPFFEGWVLWIDSFLPLLLLPAFYTLYRGSEEDWREKGDKWLFLSGLFLGLGIVFKQILIPLSGFVLIYLIWKLRDLRAILRYILGLSLPIIFMIVYLGSIGVLKDFWYWTLVFNLTTYAQFGRGMGPTLAHFSRVALVFGLAILLLVAQKLQTNKAQLLLIFLLGSLLGLSTRFDFVHFQPALPFAILATVYGLERLGFLGRLGIISIYTLVLIWWLMIFYKGHLGNRVISFDSTTYTLAVKIRSYTSPGEKIFVFGAAPHLYQISATLPAGDVFVFQFPWFYKVAEKRILEGIIKDKPEIIVSDRTVVIEDQKITEFGKDIDEYINQNYERMDNVGTTDILRKKS